MTDLDLLMSKDPLEMTAEDIDEIIAYHRRRRATLAAGGKAPRAKKAEGPAGPKLDLKKLGLVKAPSAAPLTRRKL